MKEIRYADILNGIDESWSIKEKAKYIYWQICKVSSYDERLIYSKNPQLLQSIYNKTVSVDKYTEPKLICRALCSVYSELLNRLGIKNKLISKPSSIKSITNIEDFALIFYDEENNPYFTAVAADLQRCKYGMKTNFFGGCDSNYQEGTRNKVVIIKSYEQKEIDKKIGYIGKSEIYSDLIFDLIQGDIKQKNEFKKFLSESGLHVVRDYLRDKKYPNLDSLTDDEIKGIINNLSLPDIIKIKMRLANTVITKDDSSGPIENKKYSISLLKRGILNKSEQKLYDSFDMIKESDSQVKVLSVLRFNLNPEPIYYLYSQDTQQYVLLSIEDALLIDRDYKDKNGRKLVESTIDDEEQER